MKKLTLLFLLIPAICFGQMTRTTTKIGNINCVVYKAKVASDDWVITLHGLGTEGPADGSQLSKVDGQGYAAKAKAGFEFPFNILAPQLPNSPYFDYWMLTNTDGWFVNQVKEVWKADEIIVTGLSLGGRGSWQLLRYDKKGYIKAIAPVCGYYDSQLGPFCNLRRVPGYSVHHVNDMIMRYDWDKGGIDGYNKCGSETQTVDGVVQPLHYLRSLTNSTGNPHDAWTAAYDVTPGKDSLLKWIIQQFSPPVPVVRLNIVKTQWDVATGKIVFIGEDGKEY